jgi:hypothetical protein
LLQAEGVQHFHSTTERDGFVLLPDGKRRQENRPVLL